MAKSRSVGVYNVVLHLAPGDLSGVEHCHWRTAGCTAVCLGVGTSRVRNFPNIQMARIRRTQEFDAAPEEFTARVARDIKIVRATAAREGLRPAVRLNGTSDDPWERRVVTVDGETYPNLMEAFPDVAFYDYTKSVTRALRSRGAVGGTWPSNYHLTYSYSEAPTASESAERVLAAGGNVSVVFRVPPHEPLPQTWHGHPVVDARKHDARFLDPPGSIAGLSALGTAMQDTSGFVVDPGEHVLDDGQERRRGGTLTLARPRSRSDRRAGRALFGGW